MSASLHTLDRNTSAAGSAAPPESAAGAITSEPEDRWSLAARLRYLRWQLAGRLGVAPSRRTLAARTELSFRETAALRQEVARANLNTAAVLGILLVAVEDRPHLAAACWELLGGPAQAPVRDGLERVFAVTGHPAPAGLAHQETTEGAALGRLHVIKGGRP